MVRSKIKNKTYLTCTNWALILSTKFIINVIKCVLHIGLAHVVFENETLPVNEHTVMFIQILWLLISMYLCLIILETTACFALIVTIDN